MSKKKNGANGAHTVNNDCDLETALADGGKKVGPRYSDRLPVPIEGAELDSAATEFARLYRQRETTLEQRRDAMAGFRKTLDGIDEQMKPLADTVENHTRLADIECQDVLCRDNTVRVYRLDTGEATGEVKAADTFDFDEANGQGDTDPPDPDDESNTAELAREHGAATT